jgi:hypothetical protein
MVTMRRLTIQNDAKPFRTRPTEEAPSSTLLTIYIALGLLSFWESKGSAHRTSDSR